MNSSSHKYRSRVFNANTDLEVTISIDNLPARIFFGKIISKIEQTDRIIVFEPFKLKATDDKAPFLSFADCLDRSFGLMNSFPNRKGDNFLRHISKGHIQIVRPEKSW